jgi:TolB-like protein
MAMALVYFVWESRFAERTDPISDPVSGTASGQAPVTDAASVEPVTPQPDQQSIAVLPFDNRSRIADDAFFVEGVHDDLLTKLANIGSLKVISRTSVNKYQDTEKTIPEIAAELGVATIMEGAVQRAGNTVRINVQLIDASTDEHLWAQIFDRELTAENLFAIQTEISEKIALALQATLTPDEQARISGLPTRNLEAYDAYLAGRQLASRRNAAELELAHKKFENAVELDPEFADAWSALALNALLSANYGNMNRRESRETMETASKKALELNPNLGEPWLIKAVLTQFAGQYTEAEADYLKALELSPNYALAHHWYANYLDDSTARLSEAFEHALRATELDPLSGIDQLELADLYQKLGRFEEAEQHIAQVIKRDPEFAPSYEYMAILKEETGQFDQVVYWSRKSQALNPGSMRLIMDEVRALINLDSPERLEAVRNRLEAIDHESFTIALLDIFTAILQGNTAAALEAAQWAQQKLGNRRFQGLFGSIHLLNEDYPAARASFETAYPRMWNPASWRAAYQESVADGCDCALVMMKTGDEQMGRELVTEVLAFYENELPTYISHPERYSATVCYLLNSEPQKALALLEKQVRNQFVNFWPLKQRHPVIKPLLSEPRLQAAIDSMHIELARQRENLQRMEAEGEL